MDSLFGVSLDVWLAVSAIFDLLVLATLAVYGLRHPLLLRSAARYPRRRPWQSLLIVLGLSLSTIIVSTSFNTGDTMSFAIRSLVAGSVGRADELLIALPRGRAASPAQYLQSLLDGSFLSGNGDFFPVSELGPVMDAARQDARIAQVLPVIGLTVSATNLAQRVTAPGLNLTAVPSNDGPVFQSVPTVDGGRLAFAQLGPEDVLLDERAAAALSASDGDSVRLSSRDLTYDVKVRAIASGTELGGSRPSLYVNLEEFQQRTGRIGQVNRALVANAGSPADAVQLSSSVAQTLRTALANPRAAQRLFDLLRGDAARAELSTVHDSLDTRSREKLRALLQTLDEPAVTSRFVALATDPDLERRLAGLAFRLAGTGQGLPGFSDLAPLRVVEVKQAALDQAARWGTTLTSAFLVLGFFSLVTGLLLVILIFGVLAAERRSELGIIRALGATRGYLVLGLVYEGLAYNLGGSLVGLVLGSAAALGLAAVGNAALQPFGLRLEPHLEPR
ncbi:MAG: ABC transporter permease, partial [Chloroflexi bacterium]|nr:ABC transporter permease [Chloroflexota bacterium]